MDIWALRMDNASNDSGVVATDFACNALRLSTSVNDCSSFSHTCTGDS